MNNIEDGALATCAACAVQMGADPMLAPIFAGVVAVAIKYCIVAVSEYKRAKTKIEES